MIPSSITSVDGDHSGAEHLDAVQKMSVAELESISIEDISSLQSNALKDVLNDALRQRLEQHRGGTYTSAPKMSIAEMSKQATA